MSIKTRAGLVPVETEVPFAITTENAEDYLQKKFDFAVNEMRNPKRDGMKPVQQEDVKITLISTKCSSKFYPMMLLMPLNVLKNKQDKKNSNELDMFNPTNSEKSANMKKPFYDVIMPYLFNKDDESAFFSNTVRQNLKISLKTSHTLKANRLPKIQKFDKGRAEYIVCLIDPIRLFHDMLSDVSGNAGTNNFTAEISNVNQIKNGVCKYDVYRIARKSKSRNNSFEDKLAMEINQRINS